MLELPIIEVAGTPAEMGRRYGEAVKPLVQAFVHQRVRAARAYLRERGFRDVDALRGLGRQCLDLLKSWDHEAWVEHHATAAGAGVDPVDLYTTGNMTDIRDILILGQMSAEAEGCTTAHLGRDQSADGQVLASQTWDLNPTDIDYVVGVLRRPTVGLATFSVTCAGCQSLMAMNQHGLTVGTTNVKVKGSRIGIPYLSLLHRAVRSANRAQAERRLTRAPRAAAHTYWIADAAGVTDLECSATRFVRRTTDTGPLTRTNHCLDTEHQSGEGEPATVSSQKRLARAKQVLSAGNVGADTLKALFADRTDGVDSINRYPEDDQGTTTNACWIAEPARRTVHACRGPADRGRWITISF